MSGDGEDEFPVKDGENPHVVPLIWRALFVEVVERFLSRDFLLKGIPNVRPLGDADAADIRKNLDDFMSEIGDRLVSLPDETWESSQAQWVGDRWDILIDLWAEKSGVIDLVIYANAHEVEGGYLIEVRDVHVP